MTKLFSSRIFRFLVAGGLNTLFGLVVYTVLALTKLPTWAVLVATNAVGVVFNFITTGGLVFRDLGLARIPRFILCYAGVVLTYWLLIDRLSPLAGGRIGAMMIVILPMTVATYFVQSRFVFRGSGGGAASKAA